VTLAATAAAVTIYTLVVLPVLGVLALDYEALVSNLVLDWDWGESEPSFLGPDHAWIPLGRFLVRFGPAPWFCVVVVMLVHRLTRVPLPRILARPGSRTLVIGLVLLPQVAACLPLGQAATVWCMVEAHAWIEWYGNVDEVMATLQQIAPLWSVTLALSSVMLLRLVWKQRREGARGPWRSTVLWGWRLAALPVGAVLLTGGPLLGLHAGRVATVSGTGRQLFEERCGSCHERALSLYYVKTPAEWERTMATQVEVEGVSLTAEERQQLTSFLLGTRSFSDAWMFRTRCQRCHLFDHRAWESRERVDWQRITERIAVGSPYYYRRDVSRQIVDHLEGRRFRESTVTAAERERLAQTSRCATCHTLSHRAEHYRDASGQVLFDLVERMSDKSARPVPPERIPDVARAYGALISDEERLRQLLPHDAPPAVGSTR